MLGPQVIAENHCASRAVVQGELGGLYVKCQEVEVMAVDNDCTHSSGILGVLSH